MGMGGCLFPRPLADSVKFSYGLVVSRYQKRQQIAAVEWLQPTIKVAEWNKSPGGLFLEPNSSKVFNWQSPLLSK